MSCLKFVLITIILLSLAAFAQANDASLKTQAIHDALAPIMSPDAITAYDDFFAGDGNEYVILSIDQTPSFLMRLEKQEANYTASFVRDPRQIEDLLTTRYAQIDSQKKNLSEISVAVKEDVLKFNETRYLPEAKYDILFGINNSECDDQQSCRDECRTSEVCSYVLDKNGDSIISDIIDYQNTKAQIDSLVQKISDEGAVEGKTEVETLSYYLDVVAQISQQAQKMQQSGFLSQSYMLYAGQIVYDMPSIDDAKNQVEIAIEPARSADERRRSIDSIKEVTALRVPPPRSPPQTPQEDAQEPAQAQVEMVDEQQAGPQQNTTEAGKGDAYPPIANNTDRQNNLLSVENITTLFALLVVITTIVYLGYA
ncbi:MAG: hypothetical protein V1822_04475, partial [Candidatus Micrarchaeota archaeon]